VFFIVQVFPLIFFVLAEAVETACLISSMDLPWTLQPALARKDLQLVQRFFASRNLWRRRPLGFLAVGAVLDL
jgi:hypothetical protein